MKTAALPKSTRLFDIQEAARYTGVSATTLYKWVSQRKIPHIKMGRLVKFDPAKLDEWIKQQTVMPMPERKG
jgi:excisionase family DNA binding protein